MATSRASRYLLNRARACPPGRCVLCDCSSTWRCGEGCTWEKGTGERLCSAHSDVELVQARAALILADESRNGAEP